MELEIEQMIRHMISQILCESEKTNEIETEVEKIYHQIVLSKAKSDINNAIQKVLREKEFYWVPIPSLQGKYEITENGTIRNAITHKLLKQQVNKHGYSIVMMHISKKPINCRVHKLVAETFLGSCPDGYVVNHKDGNKRNNHVSNLEYVTSSENNIHALRMKLRKPANMTVFAKRGEEHYHASITDALATEILKCHYVTGYGCRRLAKVFNISRGITARLVSGTSWKHLNRETIKQTALDELKNGGSIYA